MPAPMRYSGRFEGFCWGAVEAKRRPYKTYKRLAGNAGGRVTHEDAWRGGQGGTKERHGRAVGRVREESKNCVIGLTTPLISSAEMLSAILITNGNCPEATPLYLDPIHLSSSSSTNVLCQA